MVICACQYSNLTWITFYRKKDAGRGLMGRRMVVVSSEVVMRYVARTVTTMHSLYIKYDYSLGLFLEEIGNEAQRARNSEGFASR